MVLRCRSVVARAPMHEEQPGPGLRAAFLHHQLDPHLAPWVGVEHFHLTEERRGARPHPPGCEVMYLFEDSRGALLVDVAGQRPSRIAPGGLYWLEGDGGVLWETRPERAGAVCHGLKMAFVTGDGPMRARTLAAAEVPEVAARGARVRVLVGDALGARSPLAGPLTVLDVHLSPGAEVAHVAPSGQHAWAMAIVGRGFAGPLDSERALGRGAAVAFGGDGDSIRLRAGPQGLQAVVAHGRRVLGS